MVHELGFNESSFVSKLEDYYNDLRLSIPNTPNYQGFLREQMIIQNIISLEDQWKRHTGNYFSISKRDNAIKKKKIFLNWVLGRAVRAIFFRLKFNKNIWMTP